MSGASGHNDHPSIVVLLDFLEGVEVDEEATAHIEACGECQGRLEELGAKREETRPSSLPDAVEQALLEPEGMGGRRWWPILVPAGGIVATIAILLVVFAPWSDPGIRLKGEQLTAQTKVLRQGAMLVPTEGFVYQPGDELLLDVVASEAGALTFLSREGDTSTPLPGLADVTVSPNVVYSVPHGLVLGCQGAKETLVIVAHPKGADPLASDHPSLVMELPCAAVP